MHDVQDRTAIAQGRVANADRGTTLDVATAMAHHVVTCRPSDRLHDTARCLSRNDASAALVVGRGSLLLGIVTDHDICMQALLVGKRLQDVRVSHAMTAEVHTCEVGDSVQHALGIMAAYRVRRLPVVDPTGRACGLLSVNDVVRAAVRMRLPLPDELVRALARIDDPQLRLQAAAARAKSRLRPEW
jgi:CBS domain-containing protein